MMLGRQPILQFAPAFMTSSTSPRLAWSSVIMSQSLHVRFFGRYVAEGRQVPQKRGIFSQHNRRQYIQHNESGYRHSGFNLSRAAVPLGAALVGTVATAQDDHHDDGGTKTQQKHDDNAVKVAAEEEHIKKKSENISEECFTEWNDDLRNIKVFSGTSNPDLAREVCSHLGIHLGRVRIGQFADGEVSLEILEEVRGQHVYVIQSSPSASSSSSPHAAFMELCFMISTAKRSSAKDVTAILPYSQYFRQSIRPEMSVPLAGAVRGQILLAMGVDRVIFVDVHTNRIDGLFHDTIPITNLQPQSLGVEYFRRQKNIGKDVVVVSTENTGTERALSFLMRLNNKGFASSMASLVNHRPERPQLSDGVITVKTKPQLAVVGHSAIPPGSSQVADWLVGDVAGKDCIIVDDLIDTADRAVNAAYALKHAGAKRIYMFATHGLFSRGAIDRIVNSPIREVVITDSIRLPENLCCEKLRIVSISKLLAETIRRVHLKEPLSKLYRDEYFDSLMSETLTQQ